MMHHAGHVTLFKAIVMLASCMVPAGVAFAAPPVQHPNLLLNREDIAQVKDKIAKYPWAAKIFETLKDSSKDYTPFTIEMPALVYALTGDKSCADRVRGQLLGEARQFERSCAKLDPAVSSDFAAWNPWASYAWAYDLTYDTFTDEERQTFEHGMRTGCKWLIDHEARWTTTPNLIFGMRANIGVMGYCLGDGELINFGVADAGTHGPQRGGLKPMLDSMVKDHYFWGETPIYALAYDLHAMLALAEAALHYDGTDLYHYASPKTGASIRSFLDGYIRMGFPIEQTGLGKGSIRVVNYGDGSTNFNVLGSLNDIFLVNRPQMTKSWSGQEDLGIQGELEIAYKRYKDPGFAWLLSLSPARDVRLVYGRAVWGYPGLTHGEPELSNAAPPPAPSGVYQNQGFAMIRSDESPNYWTTGAIAAGMMLGNLIGHGHQDYYSLTLHGKGRLLYPQMNVIQYEADYLGWTRYGIGHSTLLVDGQSPSPGPYTTRQDFAPAAKFFAISGSAFKEVAQTRALLMTKEYVADVFRAADTAGNARTFDWVLHGIGHLYPGNPGAYRPTAELVPYYWSIGNEPGRTVDYFNWQMDWIQRTAGIRQGLQMGDEWFKHEVGVRMTMLGVEGTGVYFGDGGLVNGPPNFRIEGNPEGSVPVVVARRQGAAATFAAVHEPYEGQSRIRSVKRLAETPEAIAMRVDGPDYTDYLLIAFDNKEHSLAALDRQAFTFSDHAYFRFTKGGAMATGSIAAFRIAANLLGKAGAIEINGKAAPTVVCDGFAAYGLPPEVEVESPFIADRETPAEQGPYLHAWLHPEEVHVSALGGRPAREAELHLRCVGPGEVKGRLQVVAPEALDVEPSAIDVPALSEGTERVVTLKVRSTEKAANDLYAIKLVPTDYLNAPVTELTVSVGVVVTLDRRVPNNMQHVVRAPGYSIKIDGWSGFPSWLLDAEGNRRYAAGTIRTNLSKLTPLDANVGQMRDAVGGSVWINGANFTCLTTPARTGYTFEEDRIVFSVIPPTNPYELWALTLPNYLDANPPVKKSGKDADYSFIPSKVFRQGLMVTAPPPPSDYKGNGYVSKVGQQVILQFVTEAEFQARTDRKEN